MIIGRNYEIMQNELDGDFSKMHVKIKFRVTEVLGTDAITRVHVESTDGEKTWGTVGVSDNVITASWEALVDSVSHKIQLAS